MQEMRGWGMMTTTTGLFTRAIQHRTVLSRNEYYNFKKRAC